MSNNCKVCGIALPHSENPVIVCPDCSRVFHRMFSSVGSHIKSVNIPKIINDGLQGFLEVYYSSNRSYLSSYNNSVFHFGDIVIGFKKTPFESAYDIQESKPVSIWLTHKQQLALRPYCVVYKKYNTSDTFHTSYYKASATVGDIILDIVNTITLIDQITSGIPAIPQWSRPIQPMAINPQTPTSQGFVPQVEALDAPTVQPKQHICDRCKLPTGHKHTLNIFSHDNSRYIDFDLCDECYELFNKMGFTIYFDEFTNEFITYYRGCSKPGEMHFIEIINGHLYHLNRIYKSYLVHKPIDTRDALEHIEAVNKLFISTSFDIPMLHFADKASHVLEFYKKHLSF